MRRWFYAASIICVLITLGGCAAGSPPDTPEASGPPIVSGATIVPTATIPPTPAEPSPTPQPDIDGFQRQLEQALNAGTGDALRPLMRDVFAVGYWQSEGGVVTTGDALTLLGEDFLSGPGPVVLLPDIDPATITDDLALLQGANTARIVFSQGWGATGADQALIAIGVDEGGSAYWYGMVYARGGFIDLATIATETPTATPVPTAEAPAHGPSIYETDFRYGWPIFDLENGSTSLAPQGYRLDVGLSMWIYSTQVQRDTFYAEVEAQPTTCPRGKALYGLVFHYVDDANFRFFVVTCGNGYVLYERTSMDSSKRVAEGDLPAGIEPADGPHKLAVHATGNSLVLYVDDYLIETVSMGDMPVGDVGLYAETVGGPIAVVFTRLAVFEAE
jgi:hypothetical protein